MIVPIEQTFNVSFPYIDNWNTSNLKSPFQYLRRNFDLNFMCIYCKNEFTDLVKDDAVLNIYSNLFKNCLMWKMIYCSCCSSTFFIYKSL